MSDVKETTANAGAATATAVAEPGYEGDLKHLKQIAEETKKKLEEGTADKDSEEYLYQVSAPMFIMFAEYLGYVGKTLKWVDDWCVNKKKPEEWKRKFIETEAVTVLNEAKKKYGIIRMRELYDQLFEVILKVYAENLAEMETSEAPKDE